MSDQARDNWTGTRLSPLPSESTLSTLWRFGSLNGLRGGALSRTCFNRSGLPSKSVVLQADLTNFINVTNWDLPSSAEKDCRTFSSATIGTWLHDNLRFCPICLEAGYHSIWYQFRLLHACPLHGCMLTQHCQSCGHRTDAPAPRSQSPFHPYTCPLCKGPLAGAKQSISEHLEFRVHAQQAELAFAPFCKWLSDAALHLAPLQNMVERRSWMTMNQSKRWCDPEELIRATAMQLLPFPSGSGNAENPICLLRWRIGMQTLRPAPGYGRLSHGRRVQTSTAVFRATVRMLQRWIFTSSSIREREQKLGDLWTRAQEEDAIDVLAWNPYELAYVLMRCSQCGSQNLGADVSSLTTTDIPDIGLATYEGRAPRLAYRGAYLAIYAGYYHLVTRARRTGTLGLANLRRLTPLQLTAVFNLPNSVTSVVSGGVFFPRIPGMPTHPFSTNLCCFEAESCAAQLTTSQGKLNRAFTNRRK